MKGALVVGGARVVGGALVVGGGGGGAFVVGGAGTVHLGSLEPGLHEN